MAFRLLANTKSAVSRHLPLWLRKRVWYLTDKDYRKRYRAEMSRIEAFNAFQSEAWATIWEQSAGVVSAGPFMGLRYLRQEGKFNQKILGTYEKELAALVERLCTADYRHVVDIGAAEGYYACGFAWRQPKRRVIAFELQESQRRNLTRLAELNGVTDSISLFGGCECDQLNRVLDSEGPCLLVCDVDGAEEVLLDIERVPKLLECDLLVEVHDGIVPGVSEILRQRFSASHSIQHITQSPRSKADLPTKFQLSDRLALGAMDEFRSVMNDWLWMERR